MRWTYGKGLSLSGQLCPCFLGALREEGSCQFIRLAVGLLQKVAAFAGLGLSVRRLPSGSAQRHKPAGVAIR